MILEFDTAIDQIENPVLVFDGWVEYPYSQTMFSAWQANATYHSLTLDALDRDGNWETLHRNFGYMAGMPRRSALPIDHRLLPTGASSIRLSSNLELFIDSVFVAESAHCEAASKVEFELTRAKVADVGFPKRTNNPQKRPSYHYSNRVPLWDTKHLRGSYSRFGDAIAQVAEVDDELSIIGPGEEIELRFVADRKLAKDKRRLFVLEANGWCKDRDLFTQFSETVKPIPKRSSTKKKNETVPSKSRYRD